MLNDPRGGRWVGHRLIELVLAGVPVGVLIGGVGSRLAMLLLRVTSPSTVIGVTSDDGFEIGRFTLGGTYNLLNLGAFVGIIAAGVYQGVRPWLVGPGWFRYLTCSLGAGAVVGALLIHADGVDFNVLKPAWLAIGLFVAIPAVCAAAIGPTSERLTLPDDDTVSRGRLIASGVLVVLFPLGSLALLICAPALVICATLRSSTVLARFASLVAARTIVRAAWLTIALAGLVTLVRDIRDIA